MGDKLNNVGNMMKNPDQRNKYLAVVGLAVLTIVVGMIIVTKGNNAQQAPAGANVAAIPDINSTPGLSNSAQYNKEVQAQNEAKAQLAASKGESFLPTPTNNNLKTESLIEKAEAERLEKERLAKEEADKLAKEKLAKEEAERLEMEKLLAQKAKEEADKQNALLLAANANKQVVVQTPVKSSDKYTYDDYILLSVVSSAWANKTSKSEFDFAGKPQNQGSSQANSLAQSAQNTNSPIATQVVPLAKAGTIYSAVLETGVNSDEPSPVLAKIISGPLTGTRVIGSQTKVGEKMILSFTTANIKNLTSTVKISAVAVDPTNSRTALATDVDNHYFLRYGVLLASAFLGGYADAITSQNTTVSVSSLGTITQQNGPLSSEEITKKAIGSVGKELAQQTKQQTQNLQPTITVDSGTAIGILLMEDLVVKQ